MNALALSVSHTLDSSPEGELFVSADLRRKTSPETP